MNDLLDGLAPAADIKDDGDFLGGFAPLESDLYDCTVKLAYLTASDGGAKCMNVTFITADGRELKQQFWMTSSKAKGGMNYYTNKKTLEKHYLPGFIMATHLSQLTAAGKEVHQLTVENRHIKLYSFQDKKEVATEVPMFVEMLGKPVTLGVVQQLVDVNSDSGTVDANGKKIYVPTGKSRKENEVVKMFRTRDKMTVTEITAKATEAVFAEKWLTKNKGVTVDKTSKGSGVEGKASTSGTVANPETAANLGALFA
jgi:hypothetical protein